MPGQPSHLDTAADHRRALSPASALLSLTRSNRRSRPGQRWAPTTTVGHVPTPPHAARRGELTTAALGWRRAPTHTPSSRAAGAQASPQTTPAAAQRVAALSATTWPGELCKGPRRKALYPPPRLSTLGRPALRVGGRRPVPPPPPPAAARRVPTEPGVPRRGKLTPAASSCASTRPFFSRAAGARAAPRPAAAAAQRAAA